MVVAPLPGRAAPPPVLDAVQVHCGPIRGEYCVSANESSPIEPGVTSSWPTLPTSQEPPSTLCSTLGGASSAMDNIQVIEDRGAVSHRRSVGRWACTGARAGTRRRPCSSACGRQGAPWSCSAAGTAPAPEHQHAVNTRTAFVWSPGSSTDLRAVPQPQAGPRQQVVAGPELQLVQLRGRHAAVRPVRGSCEARLGQRSGER